MKKVSILFLVMALIFSACASQRGGCNMSSGFSGYGNAHAKNP